jgi:hypothetical protein
MHTPLTTKRRHYHCGRHTRWKMRFALFAPPACVLTSCPPWRLNSAGPGRLEFCHETSGWKCSDIPSTCVATPYLLNCWSHTPRLYRL